jgi:hypothetical protein
LQINGIHIRFEDDYFSGENPYAWGIQIDVKNYHFHLVLEILLVFLKE